MENNKTSILTKIVTPSGVFFEEHVKFVSLKIAGGYATFLPDHTPLISYIKPSTISINVENKTNKVGVILDGVISVFPTHIQIVTNHIVWSESINVDKAKNKIKKLNEDLSNVKDNTSYEYKQIKKELLEQNAIIKAKEMGKG